VAGPPKKLPLERRVDQLVIARQLCLDGPGQLVGQYLNLARLDGVEGLLSDRFRADLDWLGATCKCDRPAGIWVTAR
jgi:hypothetical protein